MKQHEPHALYAGLILIGNEILSGRTQDKNTQTIAKALWPKGIFLKEVAVIPDSGDKIVETVRRFADAYDFVLTTGGIGPTHDDITAEYVSRAFDVPLIIHPDAHARLLAYYGEENFNDARRKMALIPQGATLIDNPVTVAPGFRINNVFVMAGVPKIMQGMLTHVIEQLPQGAIQYSETVICDYVESVLAQGLEMLQKKFDGEIGSYPSFEEGARKLQLVVRGFDHNTVLECIKEIRDLIESQNGRILQDS